MMKMDAIRSCALCEKVVANFQAKGALKTLLDLPNTFEASSKKYLWKHHDLMEYSLIPRSITPTGGEVDLYICMDEDELDDVDVDEYAHQFLKETILPAWKKFESVHTMPAGLSTAEDIICWKLDDRYCDNGPAIA